MQTTNNMGLKKPETADVANVADLNYNADALDGHRHLGGTDGLAVKAVQSGPIASRPAGVTAGQLYVATDDGPSLHMADGSQWVRLGAALPSYLTNGGFEIWQRGNGTYSQNGAYTADRWYLGVNGATVAVDRETAVIDGRGEASLRAIWSNISPGGGNFIHQQIENYAAFRGLAVTFSVRVKASAPNAVRLRVRSNDGTTNQTTDSSYHQGDNQWRTLSVTATLLAAQTIFQAKVLFDANCTAYLDNAMLVLGSTSVEYAPPSKDQEWSQCQRYYEKQGGTTNGRIWCMCYAPSVNANRPLTLTWSTRKAATPSVTKNGGWYAYNCGQPAVYTSDVTGCAIYATSLAAGEMQYNTQTDAAQNIVAEANP